MLAARRYREQLQTCVQCDIDQVIFPSCYRYRYAYSRCDTRLLLQPILMARALRSTFKSQFIQRCRAWNEICKGLPVPSRVVVS